MYWLRHMPVYWTRPVHRPSPVGEEAPAEGPPEGPAGGPFLRFLASLELKIMSFWDHVSDAIWW